MAWKAALDGIAARMIVVNTTEASFPFLEQLSQRGRVVITATDSAMQRYATMFAEYFVKAISCNPANDVDRDGRVSIWEIFEGSSEGIKRYYEQRGQLSDRRGVARRRKRSGRGRSAVCWQAPMAHWHAPSSLTRSRTTTVDCSPGAAALAVERRLLEGQIDELRLRRPLLTEADYAAQMEALLVRLVD